jgi:hypothetical protein
LTFLTSSSFVISKLPPGLIEAYRQISVYKYAKLHFISIP